MSICPNICGILVLIDAKAILGASVVLQDVGDCFLLQVSKDDNLYFLNNEKRKVRLKRVTFPICFSRLHKRHIFFILISIYHRRSSPKIHTIWQT